MATAENPGRHFDLTPHPRILPMLGEIVLEQWRCLAELVDNSIDSFIEAQRAGKPVQTPVVAVTVPTGATRGGRLSVRDNGPGMDADTLERAARAGWTSHDPINNLGLFGMGFNIATARLGFSTKIWTTRSGDREWVGLEIDFEQLTRQKAFITPALTRPKPDPDLSGSEVVVERLKSEQLDWFSKSHNRSNISKQLGRIYSSMIGPAGSPIRFRLEINGAQVRPKLHCIWGGPGNEERTVETAKLGTVNAFQSINLRLEPRPFCNQCWNWLGADQTICPSCEASGLIVHRERRVHGWLGIQRYLDRADFGIDILRNGRKIEVGSKDLFKWIDESSNREEIEYPIDDPRDRGRIVGEIHLDHCRVPYTKDRFVREDAAWREMVELVRGRTPLRPDIAAKMGAGENNTPLYRLFQAFRRSNPHNKRAGGWSRILVVPDNDRAQGMAKRFNAGEREYETDQRWWQLVEEAEIEVLRGSSTAPVESAGLAGGQQEDTFAETLGGGQTSAAQVSSAGSESRNGLPPPARNRLAGLSRIYQDDLTGQRFEVSAFVVQRDDPVLIELQCPWIVRRTTSGWEFYVNTTSPVFQSITLTPLDALLNEIAWLITDFERAQIVPRKFGEVLTSLRDKYAACTRLDPKNLVSEALAQLVDIGRSIVGRISAEEARAFFEGLSPSRQESVQVAMASRGVPDPNGAIDDGRFLQYALPGIIGEFVLSNPTMFFDGYYWDEELSALDYGTTVATDEARSRVLGHYGGLLADVVWLAQQNPADLESMSRERLLRSSLATALLAPTAFAGDGE